MLFRKDILQQIVVSPDVVINDTQFKGFVSENLGQNVPKTE